MKLKKLLFKSLTAWIITGAGLVSFVYYGLVQGALEFGLYCAVMGLLVGFLIEKIYPRVGSRLAKTIITTGVILTVLIVFPVFMGEHNTLANYAIALIPLIGGGLWAWHVERVFQDGERIVGYRQPKGQDVTKPQSTIIDGISDLDTQRLITDMIAENYRNDVAELRAEVQNLKTGGSNGKITSKETALKVLELEDPFTKAQLKKRRMEMLKRVHPDAGGSNSLAQMVNESYELLNK